MTKWSSLLSTKYEDRDLFLSFYSKTKGIIHKLTNGNSIAAKDGVFLKAYFSMAIEAKELQTEVKCFLLGTNATYSETLKIIHADFRVQMTGEHLNDHDTVRYDEYCAKGQDGWQHPPQQDWLTCQD